MLGEYGQVLETTVPSLDDVVKVAIFPGNVADLVKIDFALVMCYLYIRLKRYWQAP